MKSIWQLGVIVLLSPLIWFVSLGTNFAVAPLACRNGGKWAMYAVLAAAFVATGICAAVLWSWSRQPEPSGAEDGKYPPDARRLLAIGGVGVAAMSFIAIVAQAIPTLMMAGCE